MNGAVIGLTVVLVLAFGAAGTAKVAATADMRRRADHLGYPVMAYGLIGGLELASVVALLAGLVLPALTMAAAVGLTAMMLGAIASHLRAGDGPAAAAPAAVLALVSLALLVLAIETA